MSPELFIRRPVMTWLVMAGILVFGIFAYRLLPVSDLPNVDFPTIQVAASLPGASPDTMASAVATPLERQFSTIAGIDSMTSHERARHSPRSPCSSASSAISTPPPRTCRRPSPPPRPSFRRACRRPLVQEGEPGRPARPVSGAELADPAAVHGGRVRPDQPGAAHLHRSPAWPRCRSSARRSTRCASSSTRTRSPAGASASTRCRRRSPSRTSTCPPARCTGPTRPSASRPPGSSPMPRPTGRSSSPIAMARPSASSSSGASSTACRPTRSRAGTTTTGR